MLFQAFDISTAHKQRGYWQRPHHNLILGGDFIWFLFVFHTNGSLKATAKKKKKNNFTDLERLRSPNLSTEICYIHLFTPFYLCLLLPPPISRRKKIKTTVIRTKFSSSWLTVLFFSNLLQQKVSLRRLCPSPNWLERRNCLNQLPWEEKHHYWLPLPFLLHTTLSGCPDSPHSMHLLIPERLKPAGAAAVGWSFPWNNGA